MLLRIVEENKGIIVFTLLILGFMVLTTNRVEKLNNYYYTGVVVNK